MEEALRGFLEFNRQRGVDTILLQEANALQVGPTRLEALRRKHRILRRLGKEYGVPVLPLHRFLNGPDVYDSGLLWWDNVHLSSWGQALAAGWLLPRLRARLE